MSARFAIYAPLQDFLWDGNDFELAPDLWIKRFRQPPNLFGLEDWIAKDERESALGVRHWLTVDWTEGIVPSPSEVGNLVLLSLWLVKPTRAQIVNPLAILTP
jgi:hypothetical protein